MVILLPRCLFYYQDGCYRKILPSNSYTLTPHSQFPIPDSQFPIPNPRFPIPDSRFPIPDSRFPTPLFKTKNPNSWGFSYGIKFVKKVSKRASIEQTPWRARYRKTPK
ncbi:hypothetical protein [Moorena producens]|uniref:hypothetical protein n=1 Tax=Moorena producens TaxID=1155739 RepID=UPI003C766F28